MARQEHDREDLLREATALVERIELGVEGFAEPVVIGFRRGSQASVFFGGDPVFQFNARNELRRAYVEGRLLKAEAGRLVRLQRQRVAGKLQLISEPLIAEASAKMLAECRERLAHLAEQFNAGGYQVVGQVPTDVDILSLVCQWLAALPPQIAVAEQPYVG